MEAQMPVGPTVSHSEYLGASDIGAVAGQSNFLTALDVFAEKRGITNFEGNEFTEVGSAYERPTLELYARRNGLELEYPGTLVHPKEGWAAATPDAIANKLHVSECKIVGIQMLKFWGEPEDREDGIPADVLCQVHWQSWIVREVLGIPCELAHVVAGQGTHIKVYEVAIEDDLIEGLVEIGREFWEKHVIGGEMPEVTGEHASDILAAIHPRHKRDKLLPMTAEVERLAREYDEARAYATEAEAAQKEIGAKLKALVGDEAGYQGNGVKCSWKAKAGSPEWKAIAQAAGASKELIKQHTPEFGARVLVVRIK